MSDLIERLRSVKWEVADFQCQHLWSAVGADGYMECRWCMAKQLPPPTTISDHTTPLQSNT